MKCCRDCYFLSMINHDSPTGDTDPRPWSEEERSLKFNNDNDRMEFYRFFNHEALCYKGMWKNKIKGEGQTHEVILNTNRDEACFFVKYRNGMNYEAASDLFHVENDNRQLKTSYKYTQIGLFIAAIGVFFAGLENFVKYASKLISWISSLWN